MKTFGMVNANPETIKGSECITIINGFSNLMMEVCTDSDRISERKTIFRCLGQRRVWAPGVQLGLPRCPTIAPLRSSASSRSRKMSVSTNIAESDLGNSKISDAKFDKYNWIKLHFLSTSIYSSDFVFQLPPRAP